MRVSWADCGLFLLISLCWTVCSVGQLVKYFHGKAVFFLLAGMLGIAALLFGLRWLQSRRTTPIHWAWFAAFWVTMTALYAVLYPIAQSHIYGPGSDGEDALRVAASQMLQLHFPYYLRTYMGHAITPMPGALILSLPFLLMGRVSLQGPVWLAVFIFFCVKFFRFRSTALAFLLVILLGGADVLDDFVVGYDYSINTLYICVAVFLFLQTYEENEKGWRHILVGVFLGVALSSRAIYVVIPPLVMAYMLQNGKGIIAALRSLLLPILTAVAITVPYYLYDPAHFTPLQVAADKLDFLPPEYVRLLMLLLPTLALLIACIGFFLRLTISRLFLLAGLASAMILLPSGLIAFCLREYDFGFESLCYCEAAAIFIALWAFFRFERGSLTGTC